MVLQPQRNRFIFGTRAFDAKPTPTVRKDEYVAATGHEVESSRSAGTLVAVQRLLLHKNHMYVRGRTRSGKTAGTVFPTIVQMLCPYDEHWRTPDGQERCRENRSAIVVVDAKADKALANSLESATLQAGRVFQHLTLSPDYSWRFNPFSCFTGHPDDAARISPNLLASLELDYGAGYGAQFYTVQAAALLFDVCEHLSAIKRNGKTPTIDDANRFIRKHARSAPRDSDSLLSTLKLLSHYPHLQPDEVDPHIIKMKEAILDCHVVLISVDALNQGAVARLVAGLVLSTTLSAATEIASEQIGDPSPLPHTFCVIDEFHHLVSRNASRLLTGAAGVGLTFCLCTQSTDTLKLRDLDLSKVVWENCAIKCLHSSFEEEDIRNLQALSRETVRPLGSRTVASDFRYFGRQALSAESESDRLEPLLTRREILELSKQPHRCYVIHDEGDFEEPIPTDTFFAETYQERLASEAQPWPKSPSPLRSSRVKGSRSITSKNKQQPAWLTAHLSQEKSPLHAARIDRFQKLLAAIRAEEQPRSQPS